MASLFTRWARRPRGAPSCTRLEVSLRASQKHLANNSVVPTKTQLLNKVSKYLPATNSGLAIKSCFWGDAHAGVSCRLQVDAPTPIPS